MINKIINFFKKKDFLLVCAKDFTVEWTDDGTVESGTVEFYKCKNTGIRKVIVIGKFHFDAEKRHPYVIGAKSWVSTGIFLGKKLD